jgi:hypothetical protein
VGFFFIHKIKQKDASPCYCIHFWAALNNSALVGPFTRFKGSGRFHMFTHSRSNSNLLCRLGHIFFAKLSSLFVHELSSVSFKLINAREGVMMWVGMGL